MKALGLYLENYGSFYGRHYIPLADRGLTAVWGENLDEPRTRSNGAGKSTWADALDWCLWGDVPRGDVADSVVNDIAGERCCVTVLILGDAGEVIKVRRVRSYPGVPNGLSLWVGDEDRTALDTKETQRRVELTLGMDRVVFHAAVLFAQGDLGIRFCDATDSERKDVLTRILPELAEVDALLEKTTALHAAASAELIQGQARRDSLALVLTEQERVVAAATAAAAGWEAARQQQVEHARAMVAWCAAEAARIQASAAPTPAPVVADIPPPGSGDPAPYRERLEIARRAVQAADVELGTLRHREAEARQQAARTLAAGVPCHACGQVVTAAHAAMEQQRLRQQVEQVVGERVAAETRRVPLAQAFQAAQEALQRAEGAWHAWQVARESARAQAAQQAAEQARREREARGLWEQRERERQQWQAALEQQQAAPNTALADLQTVTGRLEDTRAQYGQAVQRADALATRVARLAFWKVGFGAKGLKSYVLDGKVQQMTEEANRWVRLLTGGTVWVEFTTQRETGKGKAKKMVEDFSLRVFRANPDGTVTQRPYRSWSGGEKYRVSLGVDFGLARLVAQRARCAWDLLILDEVFQKSLDGAGKEAVADLLQELAKEKSSIFVIDHEVQFQSAFQNRMIVRKQNRRSSVVDGVSYVQSESPAGPGGGASHLLADHSAFPD